MNLPTIEALKCSENTKIDTFNKERMEWDSLHAIC